MNIVLGFSTINVGEAGEISKEGKIVSRGRKKARLIFENSIQHSLLNFAVTKKRSVPIKVQIADEVATVSVNVNSVAKRLGVKKKVIQEHYKNKNLEIFINERVATRKKAIRKDFRKNGKRTWKPVTYKGPLYSISQKIKAKISDIFLAIGLRFRLKHSLLSDRNLQKLSEARAAREFRRAAKHVPAYQEFLERQDPPKRFHQILETDKASYILTNSIEETCIGGVLPRGGSIDTSTGTTGNPTVWVRSAEERAFSRKVINRVREELIGDAVYINAYALGSLSTGMTIHTAIVEENLIASVGPDCDKVLAMIKQFGKDNKIVVTGYPSFLNLLINKAEKEGFDLKEYELVAVVGGEAISEILRDRLTDAGFSKIISGYGASDLDINIGFETDFSTKLRKACIANPALAKELFGKKKGVPMIFQYNPLLYYIESNKKGQLLYTSASGKKASPRVRYNSHDIGTVMTKDELRRKLKQFHLDLEIPDMPLPFLFVWGREGIAASHFGAKVIPDELEAAIESIPEMNGHVENYALHTYEDRDGMRKLGFFIELKEGVEIDSLPEDLNDQILEYIREHSVDFKKMDDIPLSNGGERPTLSLFAYGEGPMANPPVGKKKQYIYEGLEYLVTKDA